MRYEKNYFCKKCKNIEKKDLMDTEKICSICGFLLVRHTFNDREMNLNYFRIFQKKLRNKKHYENIQKKIDKKRKNYIM